MRQSQDEKLQAGDPSTQCHPEPATSFPSVRSLNPTRSLALLEAATALSFIPTFDRGGHLFFYSIFSSIQLLTGTAEKVIALSTLRSASLIDRLLLFVFSQRAADIQRPRWTLMLPLSPSQVCKLTLHYTRSLRCPRGSITNHLCSSTVRVRPFTIREAAQL